ncbi:hypothetical protein ZIOFF_060124 [Zingiber officinale]|uniref:Uncharacterized protein n=1 Tax=Zingiber officinale TaxID=94328 RepID=A0A8J5F871_ZINOF|nr:hypothetical protein ZIOFF_060124 [Zingiber officinale]
MGVDYTAEELKADLLLSKISSKIVCDPIEARKFSDPIFACVGDYGLFLLVVATEPAPSSTDSNSHVNVARHLIAEVETLLSATLIHEVTMQVMDEKFGCAIARIVLPRLVMHTRYHYGAFFENFTGLELEDGGGCTTSGSHWEKRLLMNEIMMISVDTRYVVSEMTLVLLEDSGWYQTNYNIAEHLDWGRNQGAEFLNYSNLRNMNHGNICANTKCKLLHWFADELVVAKVELHP